jgi:ribonuclease H2 subunit B
LAQPLEQCLWDEDFPDTSRLRQCKNLELSLVADPKGDESLQAFKYNEDKSLKWLQKKVEKVANVLKQKGIHVSQNAISATYVTSTKSELGTEAGETNMGKKSYDFIWIMNYRKYIE